MAMQCKSEAQWEGKHKEGEACEAEPSGYKLNAKCSLIQLSVFGGFPSWKSPL